MIYSSIAYTKSYIKFVVELFSRLPNTGQGRYRLLEYLATDNDYWLISCGMASSALLLCAVTADLIGHTPLPTRPGGSNLTAAQPEGDQLS